MNVDAGMAGSGVGSRLGAHQLSPLDLSLPQAKSMPPVQVQNDEVEPAATCRGCSAHVVVTFQQDLHFQVPKVQNITS